MVYLPLLIDAYDLMRGRTLWDVWDESMNYYLFVGFSTRHRTVLRATPPGGARRVPRLPSRLADRRCYRRCAGLGNGALGRRKPRSRV